ncbi:MAG TPA: peptidoglycan bridge formation glycyltransferase FemA/FemB family protein [Anaerolineales bacterium]|nr:peptidoglycan bridge formation glycyltransferase FemA/FemB family protein [Anaerolineales bacterium]HLO30736.1 peptidoglycan bridge formation glycyltransferase FemA/FemB family protein [Anaerolineales bacterium]
MESKVWNSIISELPDPHFLQTYEWGEVKAKYGWSALYAIWTDERFLIFKQSDHWPLLTDHCSAACMILKRVIPMGGLSARLSILYAPKGPLLDWTNESLRNRVLNDLQTLARKEGAIFLKIDPDVVLGTGIPAGERDTIERGGQVVMSELKRKGWRYSSDQIQFKNTIFIDLGLSEEEMLARMKQKTRYNIRLAEKKGVALRVGTSNDLDMLYKMYAETSVRDGFVIRDEEYYRTVWKLFMNSSEPTCEPLIAEVDGEPVAAIFVFYFEKRAYYVYGMSRNAHREKMPTYLLQWEAMQRARAKGCTVYDLWGAPDVFDESDSMWGVYRFKEGLGGRVLCTLGAWDFAPNPFWYELYSEIIPRMLDLMRSRGKARTKQSLGA